MTATQYGLVCFIETESAVTMMAVTIEGRPSAEGNRGRMELSSHPSTHISAWEPQKCSQPSNGRSPRPCTMAGLVPEPGLPTKTPVAITTRLTNPGEVLPGQFCAERTICEKGIKFLCHPVAR